MNNPVDFWGQYAKAPPTFVEQSDLPAYLDAYGVDDTDDSGKDCVRAPTMSEMMSEDINIFCISDGDSQKFIFAKGVDQPTAAAFLEQLPKVEPTQEEYASDGDVADQGDYVLLKLDELATKTETETLFSNQTIEHTLGLMEMEQRMTERFDLLTTNVLSLKAMMVTQKESVEASMKVSSHPIKISPRVAAGSPGVGKGGGKPGSSTPDSKGPANKLNAMREEVASRRKATEGGKQKLVEPKP